MIRIVQGYVIKSMNIEGGYLLWQLFVSVETPIRLEFPADMIHQAIKWNSP